jgi:hypothetical protein
MYMIIALLVALFLVPMYLMISFWPEPSLALFPTIGRYIMIGGALLYSFSSFLFIRHVAPTVLWRMKKPAQQLAREETRKAAAEFETHRESVPEP